VRVSNCDAGVIATKVGSPPAPSNTSTTSTVATSPPETTTSTGDQCDVATLRDLVQSGYDEEIVGFAVSRCNERWAIVSYGVDDQEDVRLLEWNGTTWIGGACQKYGDPNNILLHSPVVPDEFWLPCTVD
jgi:hypothetical protein